VHDQKENIVSELGSNRENPSSNIRVGGSANCVVASQAPSKQSAKPLHRSVRLGRSIDSRVPCQGKPQSLQKSVDGVLPQGQLSTFSSLESTKQAVSQGKFRGSTHLGRNVDHLLTDLNFERTDDKQSVKKGCVHDLLLEVPLQVGSKANCERSREHSQDGFVLASVGLHGGCSHHVSAHSFGRFFYRETLACCGVIRRLVTVAR